MKQIHGAAVIMLSVWAVSCGTRSAPIPVTPEDDKQVISAALRDFYNWKGATFGNLDGVIELDPRSKADLTGSADGVRSWARNISTRMDAELIGAFIRRNQSAVPIAGLIAGCPWARIREGSSTDELPWKLPKGAKAAGSLTMPGFSADGRRALLLIQHSWSIHGAVVTYVFARESGAWQVVARDQAVFL